MAPTIHKEVWDHYEGDIPHDDILKDYLLWERPENSRFTEDAVDSFISRLRETLSYAKLTGDDKNNSENGGGSGENGHENEDDPGGSGKEIMVGSYVQWTSQGVDQFQVPRKLLGAEDGYGFVEGSQTGVPMSELSVADPPASEQAKAPPINPFFTPPQTPSDDPVDGMALDRTTLDEGAVRLEWPDKLTPESVEEFQDWMIGRINRARRKAGLGKIRIEEPEE